MAVERKKISNTPEIENISGNENLLLGVTGGNKRVSTQRFKEYVGESITKVFTEKVEGAQTVLDGAPANETVYDVVYLVAHSKFAARVQNGIYVNYYSEWMGSDGYQTEFVRSDRMFYCVDDMNTYVWNGDNLVEQINDSLSVFQESTEEEIEEMIANGTWKEGVIYYTVEE